MTKSIQKTIDKGIDFLAKEQEKNGSFFCLVSTTLDDYAEEIRSPAIVPTNIVLSSLIHLSASDTAKKIQRKAAKFLLGEKGAYWSFNYWFKKSDRYKDEPYPDDTDDTFCALSALYEYKPELFDGEVMAKIVTMLTATEEKEGGPYDMWLVPPNARNKWRDIDLVCNSNIAYFLSLQDIHLPKLDAFIDKSIRERDYEFPYNKVYPGIYFISRFYRGELKKEMTKLILSKQETDGNWENPLRTGLAISSLINLEGLKHHRQLEEGIAYLMKTQRRDGSWEPYSFYFQMRTKKKTLYAGASAITTALCLEAIHKYNEISHSKFLISKQVSKIGKDKDAVEVLHQKIVAMVTKRFALFDGGLKKTATEVIGETIQGDNDRQIVLLPQYFRSALGNLGKKVSDELVIRLGSANVFGWIAYTIYDDFLDGEGDPKRLPLAQVCLRESAEIFASLLTQESGFADYSKKIFDIVDSANNWEVIHGRDIATIPDYGDYAQLADKSLGHILGPLAILFALGYGEGSSEVKTTIRFFKNYIIARQLNDDAHDWEEDLKKGQVNAVGARLLRDTRNKTHDFEKLREVFWHKTIVSVCKDISRHTGLARKDLEKLSFLEKPEILTRLLVSIERSVEKTLKEQKETMQFLGMYR